MIYPQAIIIESGHGKSRWGRPDGGAKGYYGLTPISERQFTKRIGEVLVDILKGKRKELKYPILQGVGIQSDADIIKKTQFINTVVAENQLDPDKCYTISIHVNAASSQSAHGIETWYKKTSEKAMILSDFINQGVIKYTGMKSRKYPVKSTIQSRFGWWKNGQWEGKFYIDDMNTHSIIVECGFISNPGDAKILYESTDRIAWGIAHGLMNYFKK